MPNRRTRASLTVPAAVLFLLLLGGAPAPARTPTPGPRPEEVIARALDRVVYQNIPQFKDHYFAFVIGIDSSASFADSGMSFTKLAVNRFLRQHVVPHEAVALFHFGPRPWPLLDGRFRAIPATVLAARSAIEAVNLELQKSVVQNPYLGTDVNYALYHALRVAGRAPLRNRLILIFTDEYNERAAWSKDPKHREALEAALRPYQGQDRAEQLGPGVYVRMSYLVQDDTRISPAELGALPEGPDLRRQVARMVFPLEQPPAPAGSPAAQGGLGRLAGWLWLPAALILGALLAGFLWLARPLPVTLAGDRENEVWIPLNRSLHLGGGGPECYPVPSLPETIARVDHRFPRRLTVARVKSGVPCRLVLDGGSEVEDAASTLRGHADLYWTDMRTGRFYSLHVLAGRRLAEEAPPASTASAGRRPDLSSPAR